MAANSQLQRDYFCTKCGKKTDRDKLTVKKAVFTDMGSKARTHKSRVVARLCNRDTCLPKDAEWNIPAYKEPEYEAMPEGFGDLEPTPIEERIEDEHHLDPRDDDPDQLVLPGMEKAAH
jgi:hypothetical protein